MLPRAEQSEPHKGREREEEGEVTEPRWMPMTGAERVRRHRKRKKKEQEESGGSNAVEPAGPVLTDAERMRNYRKRKKKQATEEANGSKVAPAPAVVNLEPMPGGSRDPVRFFPRPDPAQLRPSPRRATDTADSVTDHGKWATFCCVLILKLF